MARLGPIAGTLTTLAVLVLVLPARAQDAPPAAVEFFETSVRPLLVARCLGCHGVEKQKGHLRLDSRAAVLEGGSTGPAVVPGKPSESLLIDAINYGDTYQMPPKSKLPPAEIALLTRWVEWGAPWTAEATAKAAGRADGFNLKERARHWSFQPVRALPAPLVKQRDWPRNDVDLHVLKGLEDVGLAPAPEADRRTLIRRLSFDLIGLPPTPAEIDAFLSDDAPDAYERVVERLLASPHHGERWGRHWLDLVRYAETAGHEFDYDTPGAWHYRDYVVRTFNADLPYDQFVIEHLAGDLLEPPRRHPTTGTNESVLGTGFFLLGEGTHSPVDVRADQAARADNQIDVLSKTFLGLTVACARCHDHKFDAITTKDYYALAGYLRSSRHQHAFIDPPGPIAAQVAALRAVKETVRQEIGGVPARGPDPPTAADDSILFEDFARPGFADWTVTGPAFGDGPTRAGDFVVRPEGPAAVVVPAGLAHSGLISDRLQGVLRSRTFTIEKPFIHYRAAGRNGRINLVVDGFEKIRDPIYGALTFAVNSGDRLQWHSQNVAMWVGQRAYLEIADGATVDYTGARSHFQPGDGFIAVDEVRFADHAPPALSPREFDRLDVGRASASTLARYQELEARLAPPTLAPALADGPGEDEHVFIRGNHQTLGPVVPRRFLEALGGLDHATESPGSGRLELARRLVDPANPLVARVLVNRLWEHHFGAGIVTSVDDFGRMGRAPTHPALLDALAARFVAGGWSLKPMHRRMVLSSTYRMQSDRVPDAERTDPTNERLHRMNVRRLEAEPIRDAVLAVSGRLDARLFGPSVPPHLTPFMDGRGRPETSGPLDGDGRRSLYLGVRRNFLNPMFLAFDYPGPASTMGRRNVSNVPAQALALMNDPFLVSQARLWADRLRAHPETPPRETIDQLYRSAFGRPPAESEVADGLAFLADQSRAYDSDGDRRAWADLCHVLFNVKEFIYIK